VQLGVQPKAGFIYQWDPPTGLSDPTASNPVASPDTTTTYVLSARHDGGGCFSTDTVTVKAAILDNTLQVIGSPSWCIGSGDSTVLQVMAGDSVQWYRDGIPIPNSNTIRLNVTQTGTYHAMIYSLLGCSIMSKPQNVNISSIPVPGFTVDKPTQCLVNNKFVFTNTSTNAVGPMQYKWIMGDGFTATSRNLTYSYKNPGIYEVVMIVYSNDACADSSTATITVNANVFAAFNVDPVCENNPVLPVNNTIEPGNTTVNYLWDFGNGQTSTLRNPPAQAYPGPGNYVISLSVSSAQCPFPLSIQKRFARIERPLPGITYPEAYAVAGLPQTLCVARYSSRLPDDPRHAPTCSPRRCRVRRRRCRRCGECRCCRA